MPVWFAAPYSIAVPANDIAWIATMRRHCPKQWHCVLLADTCGELLVSLAFFDDATSDETKREMVTSLQKQEDLSETA